MRKSISKHLKADVIDFYFNFARHTYEQFKTGGSNALCGGTRISNLLQIVVKLKYNKYMIYTVPAIHNNNYISNCKCEYLEYSQLNVIKR